MMDEYTIDEIAEAMETDPYYWAKLYQEQQLQLRAFEAIVEESSRIIRKLREEVSRYDQSATCRNSVSNVH